MSVTETGSSADAERPQERKQNVAGGRSHGVTYVLRVLPEVALLALAGYLYLHTTEFREVPDGPGPAFWPRLLIVLLALSVAVRLVGKIFELRGERRDVAVEPVHAPSSVSEALLLAHGEEGKEVEAEDEPIEWRRVAIGIALAVGYALATGYLGYPLATAVFVAVFLFLAGRRRLWWTVPLGIGTALLFSYIFLRVVYLSLPTGVGVFSRLTIELYTLLGIY